jgi:hypothetical protein
MTRLAAFVLLLTALVPARGTAQAAKSKEKEAVPAVPKAYLPPAGMCRIWVDNVPAARQPAPTDCATAIRNRPPNARVVFPAGQDGRSGQPKGATPNRPRADTTGGNRPAEAAGDSRTGAPGASLIRAAQRPRSHASA